MEVKFTDTFFDSLNNLMNSKRPWYWSFWRNLYYDIKHTVVNMIKLFPVVKRHRSWDYSGILLSLKIQINDIRKGIEKYANEVDETRIPKVEKMKRTVELLNNVIEDNFAERCGYDHDAEYFDFVPVKDNKDLCEMVTTKRKGYEHIDNGKALKDGRILKEKEWKELINNLSHLQEWWD